MTAHSANRNGAQRARSKELQEEVARSLERELKLLADDRQERARMLGLDIGTAASKVAGQA